MCYVQPFCRLTGIKMEQKLLPIESFIKLGLAQRFKATFDVPLVYSDSPNKKALAAKLIADGKRTTYPFAFASHSRFSITEAQYKPHTLWRRGLTSSRSSDGSVSSRLNLVPVTIEYKITYLTQSDIEAQAFVKSWLIACVSKSMKFSLTYGVVNLDVNVTLESGVSFPEGTGGVTEAREYQLEPTMTVEGYMSDDVLKQQQIADSIEMLGYTGLDPNEVALMSENERASHVTFYFHSDN